MKAITISSYCGPEVLTVTELPDPEPADGEVLIAVRAFGLNHAEACMRSSAFGEVAVYERGVAGTTLDDIRSAAGVSGSQLSHYFAGKDELVQAVIDHQAGTVTGQPAAGRSRQPRRGAWRDKVIAEVKSSQGTGGSPLGSLAETDAQARALIAAGFGQWSAAISDGLRRLHDTGHLPNGTDPDDLAVTFLATLQGGLLLAQVQRDTRPLETAIDTLIALTLVGRQDAPGQTPVEGVATVRSG